VKKIALFILLTVSAFCAFAASLQQPPPKKYLEILPLFWSELYPDGGHTLYCNKKFGPDKGRSINVEHVFPMSWAVKKLRCRTRKQCRRYSPEFNRIEADMHNLYPALATINEARSAMAYGMVLGELRRFGSCDFEVDTKRRRVEPRREIRGDIARAMLYMHDTYDLTLYSRQARMLQQWHLEDPPDDAERWRNSRIEQLQGRRNRFIDDPAAAARLRF
jgi:deoxyribonuclease-1